MTVNEIATFAAETVGDLSSETLKFAKKAVRLKYQTVYDAHAWRESLRVLDGYPLDLTSGGRIFLPYDCEEVIYLSLSYDGANYTRLDYRERDWLERFRQNAALVTGNCPCYYRAENVAWPYIGPGKLTFSSYDPVLFTLYISGLDASGNQIEETYKMQAAINPDTTTNPAIITTVNSFTQVSILSKGATTFPLTVQPQLPPSTTPTIIPASVSESVYTQLVLYPPPAANSGTIWYRLQVKLKPDPLDSDYAVPRLSHITDAMIEFTLAALYKRDRQLTKADNSEQKGIAHIQAAVNLERSQSESFKQCVPVIYETGNYLYDACGRVSSSYPWGR